MVRSSKLISVIMAVSLAGCATAAQRAAQEGKTNGDAAMGAFKACINQSVGTPAYNMVNAKSSLSLPKPTFEQMIDKSKATDEEIKALFEVRSHSDSCKQQLLSSLTGVNTAYGPVFMSIWAQSDRNAADLVQRNITWGEYNVKKSDALAVFARDMTTHHPSVSGNRILTAGIGV